MIPLLPERDPASSAVRAYCAALRDAGFSGEITLTEADRVVLATDNSIYQVRPGAACFPRSADDLARVARVGDAPRFRGIALRPRGGATGTNGQSLGDGLVVDLSRHMNRVLAVDASARTVTVEAGVVKDQLNAALKPHGLFFAPELSTSNRATIGGMIATDACGQGSVLYGKTHDHVLALDVVLPDGTRFRSEPLDDASLARVRARADRVGAVHRAVDDLERRERDAIRAHFPRLNRSLTGYDLANLRRPDGRFDLNSVICGSEGTLAFVAAATLRVLPIPRVAILVNLRYASFDAALRDAGALASAGAASVETIDGTVLALARGDNAWHAIGPFFPDGDRPADGVNIVEFLGDDADRVEAAAGALAARAAAPPDLLGATVARGADVGRIWDMRKKGVGLLGGVRDRRRPVPFVEDAAVPPERLADFVSAFRALLDRRGLSYGMFGHVDAGVLHVRPALDLKDPADAPLVREVTDEVVALARRFGGLLWGEHGKGYRSEFVPAFFGPLVPALQAVKAAFDPDDRFNPGKIASARGRKLVPIDAPTLRGALDRAIPMSVRDGFDEALHCNGNGACFNWDAFDPMCPSWKATGERRHSPKGRSALLREWLRRLAETGFDPVAEARAIRARPPGRALVRAVVRALRAAPAPPDGDLSAAVKEAMDGCLACKACAGQCPIKVDVPTFRAKFLELYHQRYRRPLRDWLVGALEHFLPVAALAPALGNRVTASASGRRALARAGLVAVPALSRPGIARALADAGARRASPRRLARLDRASRARAVVIVPDSFTRFYDAPLLADFASLLVRLGCLPFVAPCRPNGKALHVHGFLGAFERVARRRAAELGRLAATGVPLVGIDPALALAFRAEYRAAPGTGGMPPVLLPQEFLAACLAGSAPAPPLPADAPRVRLLPHCTERTNAAAALPDWTRVFAHAGIALEIEAAGCCGMAGTYGHAREQRDTAVRIYDASWAPRVASARDAGIVLAATGYSCRSQAALVDGVRLPHPLQVLLARLGPDRAAR